MHIVDPAVEAYATQHSSVEDVLLQEVVAFTEIHHPKGHMLSGHLQGKLLEALSCMLQPKRILEIGTFTGYSALCLAKGLAPDGQLHTVELREADAATALSFFRRSLYSSRIILHVGDALDIIGKLDETWDLVFLDADKTGYISYFERVFPSVRPNGFILADNVLFHGQVLAAEIRGKNAKAVQEFNEYVAARKDVSVVVLPLRDGISLIRKLP